MKKSFVKISCILFLLFEIFLLFCNHKKTEPVIWECTEGGCKIYAVFKNGNKQEVVEYPEEPVWKFKSESLVEIVLSCGSPCSYSIYIDYKNEKISDPFFNAIAFDSIHQRIAYIADSIAVIQSLFNSDIICKMSKDFSLAAVKSSVVDTAFFFKNGNLVLKYLRGDDFQIVVDTVLWCR